jgi:hypothetical protein
MPAEPPTLMIPPFVTVTVSVKPPVIVPDKTDPTACLAMAPDVPAPPPAFIIPPSLTVTVIFATPPILGAVDARTVDEKAVQMAKTVIGDKTFR